MRKSIVFCSHNCLDHRIAMSRESGEVAFLQPFRFRHLFSLNALGLEAGSELLKLIAELFACASMDDRRQRIDEMHHACFGLSRVFREDCLRDLIGDIEVVARSFLLPTSPLSCSSGRGRLGLLTRLLPLRRWLCQLLLKHLDLCAEGNKFHLRRHWSRRCRRRPRLCSCRSR